MISIGWKEWIDSFTKAIFMGEGLGVKLRSEITSHLLGMKLGEYLPLAGNLVGDSDFADELCQQADPAEAALRLQQRHRRVKLDDLFRQSGPDLDLIYQTSTGLESEASVLVKISEALIASQLHGHTRKNDGPSITSSGIGRHSLN
jgi:hypothetical protein